MALHPGSTTRRVLAALVSSLLLAGVVACHPLLEASIRRIGARVEDELPPPPIDQRCSGTFGRATVESYLSTALWGSVEAAHRHLQYFSTHLQCVSAARFAEIAGAMEAVLPVADDSPPVVQEAIAPLVMLFVDLGGRFRGPFAFWLQDHDLQLRNALHSSSTLRAIGLPISSGRTVELRSGDAALRLLDMVYAPGLVTGHCRMDQLVTLEPGSGLQATASELYCPNDCNEASEDLARELGSGFPATLFPEMEAICQQQRDDFRDFKNATRHHWEVCAADFQAEPSGLMACISQASIARRQTALDLETDPQRDIEMRRKCHIGWNPFGPSPEDEARRQRYQDAMRAFQHVAEQRTEAGRHLDYLQDRHAQNKAEIRDLEETLDGFDTCTECSDPVVQEIEARIHELDVDQANVEFMIEVRKEEIQNWTRQMQNWHQLMMDNSGDGGGSGYCGPDSSCSDECGLQDQMAAEVGACIEAEGSGSDGVLGQQNEPGGAVNPWLVQPDPRDPESLVGGLTACLAQRLLDPYSGMITQNDCSAVLRCANGEMPRGQDCTCLDEQDEQRPPDDCEEVMYCTDEMSCGCDAPIPPDFQGERPSRPGSGGGGDPSPY